MNFTYHHFILIVFRILLLIVAFTNARQILRSTKKVTWSSFLPIIIAYTLYAGLRWGRGIDYNGYYRIYNDIINGMGREDNEPLFVFLIELFGLLGMEWQHFVVFMSFMLIFSVSFFLKWNIRILSFSLPLIAMNLGLAENLMRWYLGFSFILIALYYLLNNKRKYFFIFASLGFLVHYGLIVDIFIFFLVWLLFEKPMLKPVIPIAIYIGLFILFDPQFMGQFADFIQQINLGTRFMSYQYNAEAWLTGDANDDVRSEASILNTVFTAYRIIMGYLCYEQSKSRIVACLYNWALIGWVFYPAAAQIEIAMRINALFLFMGWIYTAYIYYAIIKRKVVVKPIIRYLTMIFFAYNIFTFIIKSVLTLPEYLTYYIWNSAGRATLPLNLFE